MNTLVKMLYCHIALFISVALNICNYGKANLSASLGWLLNVEKGERIWASLLANVATLAKVSTENYGKNNWSPVRHKLGMCSH